MKLDIALHIESDAPPLARKSKCHAPDDDDPIASDPEAVQVRQWRHRLQKTFLSARVTPKEEDMPTMDALFRTTKGYERKSPQYLSYSKIGEVMLHIVELKNGTIPRDDEHPGTRFRGVPVHDMRWDDPLIEKFDTARYKWL